MVLARWNMFSFFYCHQGQEVVVVEEKSFSLKPSFPRTLKFATALFDQDTIYRDVDRHGSARRGAASGAKVLKAVGGFPPIDIERKALKIPRLLLRHRRPRGFSP